MEEDDAVRCEGVLGSSFKPRGLFSIIILSVRRPILLPPCVERVNIMLLANQWMHILVLGFTGAPY